MSELLSEIQKMKCKGAAGPDDILPTFYLFYIQNLAKNLSNYAVIALSVDDVYILTTARTNKDSVAAAQFEVNKVMNRVECRNLT